MEDKEKKEVHHTGFEYLGPQSEHTGNLPPLPKRFKVRDEPVAGAEPIEKYGNVEMHFTWPELERVEKLTTDSFGHTEAEEGWAEKVNPDDEWAGKDYPTTRSDG